MYDDDGDGFVIGVLLGLLILFLVTVCSGCGPLVEYTEEGIPDPRSTTGEHPEIAVHYALLEDEIGRTIYMPSSFRQLPGTTVGQCWDYGKGRVEVFIDPRFWNYASDAERSMVVLHELGHCYLGLSHINDEWHLMHPKVSSVLPDSYFWLNRERLARQLWEDSQR